jgi:hypothetical protein
MRAQRSARPRHAGPSRPGRLCGTTPGCTLPTGRRSGWPAGSTSNRSPTTSPFVRSSSVSNHWGRSSQGLLSTESAGERGCQLSAMPDAAQLAASIQACRPRNDYPGCGAAVEVGEPFEMSVSDRRDRAGARIRCRRPQRPHPAGTPSVAILRGVLDRLWTAATRHPFLDAVREGTITDSAFDRWLGQDALFVGDLLTFQARLLARAPRPAQAVLAGDASRWLRSWTGSRSRPRGGGLTWGSQRSRRRSPTASCWGGWMPRPTRRR